MAGRLARFNGIGKTSGDVYPSTPLALTSDQLATAGPFHPGSKPLFSLAFSMADSMRIMHGTSLSISKGLVEPNRIMAGLFLGKRQASSLFFSLKNRVLAL